MDALSPLPGRHVIRTLMGNGHLAVPGKDVRAVLYNIEVFVSRVPNSKDAVQDGPASVAAFLTLVDKHEFTEFVGDEAVLILEDPNTCPWECFVRNALGRCEHRGNGPLPGTPRDGRPPSSRKTFE